MAGVEEDEDEDEDAALVTADRLERGCVASFAASDTPPPLPHPDALTEDEVEDAGEAD